MKHTVPLLVLFISTTLTAFGQHSSRYEISWELEAEGKAFVVPINSFSYHVQYETWGHVAVASPFTNRKTHRKADATSEPEFQYYISLTLKQIPTDILSKINHPQYVVSGRLIKKDRLGEEPDSTVVFKLGRVISISDGYTENDYEGSGANASISLLCKIMLVDGVGFY